MYWNGRVTCRIREGQVTTDYAISFRNALAAYTPSFRVFHCYLTRVFSGEGKILIPRKFGNDAWDELFFELVEEDEQLPQLPKHTLFDSCEYALKNCQLCCCYCGRSFCFRLHEDLKVLQLWKNPDEWLCLGYDLFISHPQTTRRWSEYDSEQLIFLVDIFFERVVTYNVTTDSFQLTHHHVPKRIMDMLAARKPKETLSLTHWAIRGLVKGRWPLARVAQDLPTYRELYPWKNVSKCLERLYSWYEPPVFTSLRRLQGPT